MAEQPPLDPMGGVINYFRGNEACPPQATRDIITSAAAGLGIGVRFIATASHADREALDERVGAHNAPVDGADPKVRLHVDHGSQPATVFLARAPRLDYGTLADRMMQLHETARDLTGRLN